MKVEDALLDAMLSNAIFRRKWLSLKSVRLTFQLRIRRHWYRWLSGAAHRSACSGLIEKINVCLSCVGGYLFTESYTRITDDCMLHLAIWSIVYALIDHLNTFALDAFKFIWKLIIFFIWNYIYERDVTCCNSDINVICIIVNIRYTIIFIIKGKQYTFVLGIRAGLYIRYRNCNNAKPLLDSTKHTYIEIHGLLPG